MLPSSPPPPVLCLDVTIVDPTVAVVTATVDVALLEDTPTVVATAGLLLWLILATDVVQELLDD